MQSVSVTSADYNGDTFDGCPFDSYPHWLRDAVEDGMVSLHADDRDYACWKVQTRVGAVIAEPGDRIQRDDDGAYTVKKAS